MRNGEFLKMYSAFNNHRHEITFSPQSFEGINSWCICYMNQHLTKHRTEIQRIATHPNAKSTKVLYSFHAILFVNKARYCFHDCCRLPLLLPEHRNFDWVQSFEIQQLNKFYLQFISLHRRSILNVKWRRRIEIRLTRSEIIIKYIAF